MITKIDNFIVPDGIKYFSESGYKLPEHPTVINKKVPGCGFTEFCLRSTDNVILCVPRVYLLENKVKQAIKRGDIRLMHICGSEINTEQTDKISNTPQNTKTDFDISKLLVDIRNHYLSVPPQDGCKYITTYDSFKYIRDSLGEDIIRRFYIVVDEFQNILKDAGFKSTVENEFLDGLTGLDRVSFISATPIQTSFLEMMPRFENVQYQEFSWNNLQKITKRFHRYVQPRPYIKKEIMDYLEGNFPVFYQDGVPIYSKELVIYINNIGMICSLIKSCGLTLENTCVLCAKDGNNYKKLRKAFGITAKKVNVFGEIPDGENNRMFTFCTSAAYSGADFYSNNARSIVFSNGKVEAMRDDPAIDLIQIAGRQRWSSNPWKNILEIYVTFNELTDEEEKEIREKIQRRIDSTEVNLVKFKEFLTDSTFISKVESDILVNKYANDYLSVSNYSGSCKKIVMNNMVMVSDLYSLHILVNIYKDEYTFGRNIFCDGNDVLDEFDNFSTFPDRMKYLYYNQELLGAVDYEYSNYFKILGPERIKACQFQKYLMDREIDRNEKKKTEQENFESRLNDRLDSEFIIGTRYTSSEIKTKLSNIFQDLGIKDSPKATSLSKWFEITPKNTTKDRGFIIVSRIK